MRYQGSQQITPLLPYSHRHEVRLHHRPLHRPPPSPPLVVIAARVSWDSTYDNGRWLLAMVACSGGKNGLLTKGYKTFKTRRRP